MKKIKYFGLLAVLAVSLNACVVHRAGWVRGHYAVGPRGGRVWVPAHYN